jgi:hypothetical protein
MKKVVYILVLFIAFSACAPEIKGDPDRFREGNFEIPAGDSYSKTEIKRVDSLHIEKYTKYIEVSTDSGSYVKEVPRIDTLYIKWKNNFFYTLRMKSPKSKADQDPIFVQITKVTDSSYEFSAKIGYSNFKQPGTVYKVD